MELLRAGEEQYRDKAELEWNRSEGLEVMVSMSGAAGDLSLEAGGLQLAYEQKSGVVLLSFADESGRGRKQRRAKIGELRRARIFLDSSAAEFYLNDGETVISTRFYPEKESLPLKITVENGTILVYHLKNIEIDRI